MRKKLMKEDRVQNTAVTNDEKLKNERRGKEYRQNGDKRK